MRLDAPPVARRAVSRVAAMIAILTAVMAAGNGMRLVFSPVQELAKAQMHLTDVQLSFVQGFAASLPIAFLSLPLGRLTDRANRMMLLAGLTSLSVIGSVLTALAPSFAALFIARMLAGIGGACALPVAISLVADLVSPERRGRAMLFLQIGQMLGAAAAFALGGGLLAFTSRIPGVSTLAPWRGVHILFGALGVVAALILLVGREPARHELSSSPHIALRVAVREVWARRGFVIPLYLGQLTVVMADSAAGIWAAPVLGRNFGLQPAQFAGWMGAVLLGSGLVGAVIGGLAADAGSRGRLPGGMLMSTVVAAALSVPAAFFPVATSVEIFGWLLALLLLCGSVTGIVTATAVAVYIPNEIRGFCLGVFIVVGAIGGLGIAPTLVPLLGQALWAGRVAPALAALTAGTSMVALIGFLIATRRIPETHP